MPEDTHGEAEIEDAVPESWDGRGPELFLASKASRTPTPRLVVARRAIAYAMAGVWPFIWLWIEFLRLDAANAMSDMCDVYGCAPESHVFVERNIWWALLLSCISVVVMAGLIRLLRLIGARRRATQPSERPVKPYAVAGLFLAVCALAFLIGVLRGVMISHLGH